MTDVQAGGPGEPVPSDRMERLIREQLRIMRKQLELMRSLEQQAAGTPSADTTAGRSRHDAADALVAALVDADAGGARDTIALDADVGRLRSADGTPTSDDVTHVPLTDAQRDVWIICQFGGDASAAFNLSTTLDLRGDLDVGALHEALLRLVQRHESLRTTIDPSGDHMIVHDHQALDLPLLDVTDAPDAERGERIEAFIDAELTLPYDLVEGPLFRATLIRSGPQDHTLVLSAHHLVSDGWSLGTMQRDLSALYSTIVRGESVPLDEAVQFSEFVTWRAGESVAAEPYWRSLYAEAPVQLDLPADRVRPPTRAFDYGTRRAIIAGDLLPAVRSLAASQGVTPFIVLLAAWQILLHRLSGQAEFASGVFVSGQASMGARSLVGLCTNLLALRADMTPEEPLADYLARLKRSTFDAFDNQHYALGNLASALQLHRDPSRPTIVSTVITLETPTLGIDFAGLDASESVHGRRHFGSFDLEAYLTETQADLIVDFKYATALFDTTTIERWLGHFVHLLGQMTTHASTPVSRLRLLDDVERQELLVRWNRTAAPVPDLVTHERFEHQAGTGPDRVAVDGSRGSLTYAELNARANQLARHLRDLGVETDARVGVHLDRSPDMIVALLAVHKAGGAYVPLDPLFPAERLAMIAEDAGLRVLVTDAVSRAVLAPTGTAVVALDRDSEVISSFDATDLRLPVPSTALAYVIYTSGSTGKPKGVEVPHIGLANLLEAMRLRPGLSASDVLLAVTTMSFDIAGLELFLPLITGATVVIADEQEAVDALWLRERLAAGDITVMQATPATWQLLLDVGWAGTPGLKALCGGEALSAELARALVDRVDSLWNMYGPTETTIWSSVSEVSHGRPVSLGRPIANTELHVLDPALELQPMGIPGELYIGGIGLARGYHDRADLTAERFIDHRFEDEAPRRLYRTGDVVRRYADGRIEYIGRADFQVKIRGFRIELGEIETVLARHPDVKECAVVARDGDDGAKRLVAYVIPTTDRPSSVSTLRAWLRETLPDYMVPAVFVFLDAFPLTANKKVDRARLPDPDGQRPDLDTAHVAPRTETEATLAGIWAGLLGVERVGVDDNFFDLGGDSLLALRSIMRANREGMNLAPVEIFRSQTVAELAHAAEAASAAGADVEDEPIGPTPLTPAQLRFLTERDTPDPHHWNVSTIVQVERLSPEAIRTAVDAVLRHHDALRIRLRRDDDGGWRQEIVPPSGEIPFESHDLSAILAHERAAAIERICTGLQGSLDLDRGPVVRVAHFREGPDGRDRLFVTIHHFAVDGLTWSVFWEDLEQAYRQAADGISVSLPPKTTSFRGWARQLRRLADTPRVLDTAESWLRQPWGDVARLPVDPDTGHGRNTNASAVAFDVEFSSDDTRRLLEGRARPEHVILTALGGSLSAWTGSPTVLIDVLSHGRDAAFEGVNLSRTVGFTLSYNPLLLSHPTWAATPEVLDAVSGQIEKGPEGFSFDLLRFLGPDLELRRRLSALPRADVLFNYAGAGDLPAGDSLWSQATELTGPEESPRGLRQYPIAIRAILTPDLRLRFVYSTELHRAGTIEAKASEVAATIRGLLGAAVTTAR